MPWTFQALHPEAFEGIRPPPFPGPGDVHVWLFSLEVSSDVHDCYATVLSSAEQARAARFKFPADRRHYIAAHGALRAILAHYAHSDPKTIVLESLPSGKPRLVCDGKSAGVEFNLTHSHGRGAVAVACDRPVGIDLEKVRCEVDGRRLAERYFSLGEQSVVRSASASRSSEVFFRHWVGKEAYLKGLGLGLRLPLDQCEVVFSKEYERAVIRVPGEGLSSESWTVRYLPLGAGWVGGVAAKGDQWTVTTVFSSHPA